MPLFNCVLLIGNFNSNVGNENAILLTGLESDDDEGIFSLKFVLNLWS